MSENTKKQDAQIPGNLPKQQGTRGHKAGRINMAFSEENAEFISTVSKDYSVNKTALVNYIIEQYRNEHPEIMATAVNHQRFLTAIHGGNLLPKEK